MEFYHKQPSHMIYAFDRGWRIERYVALNLFGEMHLFALKWFSLGKKSWTQRRNLVARDNMVKWFIYAAKYAIMVWVAGIYVAGAIQYIAAMVMTALFLAVQSLILGLWVVASFIVIGLLALYTFAYSRYYRIRKRCPDCHHSMDIPVFACPSCRQDHDHLWPSIYGIFSHRCNGGNPKGETCGQVLPSLRLRIFSWQIGQEQDKISRRCPNCGYDLSPEVGQTANVHIPIVGGPSAGKSSYILSATRAIQELYKDRYGYTIDFVDDQGTRDYQRNTVTLGQTGMLEGTRRTEHMTRAYTMKIQAPKASVARLAYFYDAPGEAYNTSVDAAEQKYFEFVDGIIFVVDPFFIRDYRAEHEDDFRQYEVQGIHFDIGLEPETVYERMFSMFEEKASLKKGLKFSHPIAIVVSKSDAFTLEEEIGNAAAQRLMSSDPKIKSEEDAQNLLVQQFLTRYGLGSLVQNLSLQFSQVRYFSCSALGRMPGGLDSSPYLPRRVEAPLIWLLAKKHAVEQPGRLERQGARQTIKVSNA